MAKRVGEITEQIDILFINAGIANCAPIEYIDEDFFDKTFNINVKGVFFTVKYLLPYLKEGVSVILNASINAHIVSAHATVYSCNQSKCAELGLNSFG